MHPADKVTATFKGANALFAIIQAAGWPIWFIIVASVIALAIIGERWWSLRESVVMPKNLLAQVAAGIPPERRDAADALPPRERLAARARCSPPG